MKRLIVPLIACGLTFGGASLITGCEDTIEHEKKVETKDGTTKVEEKKTTVNDDTGTVTKTETKDVKKD